MLLFQINEVLANTEDAAGALIATFSEQDLAKRIEKRAALITETGSLTTWIARLDGALAKNATGYFVGDHLTVADLKAVTFFNWFASGTLDGIPKEWILTFPQIAAFVARVTAHPKIAEYYAARK
jgi:glutathione S-transferase